MKIKQLIIAALAISAVFSAHSSTLGESKKSRKETIMQTSTNNIVAFSSVSDVKSPFDNMKADPKPGDIEKFTDNSVLIEFPDVWELTEVDKTKVMITSNDEKLVLGTDFDVRCVMFFIQVEFLKNPTGKIVITFKPGAIKGKDADDKDVSNTEDIVLTYNLRTSGIDEVIYDNLNTRVFNLQGIEIKHTENLPTGIYIINGKKIVVR